MENNDILPFINTPQPNPNDYCLTEQVIEEDCYFSDSGQLFWPKLSDGYSIVKTKRGKVYVHEKHGKTERKKNIATARYFAEKYGHIIWLLPNPDDRKSPDAFNETLNVFQEFKEPISTKATAIENAIHSAGKQANCVVLTVNTRMSLESLRWGLNNEIKRSKSVLSVTLIRAKMDVTFTRAEIIRKGFKIKQDDFS